MNTKNRIIEAIYRAIDLVNEDLPDDIQLNKSPDTVLYGETGVLDSVDLVSLIVTVEQEVQEQIGVPIILADERALSATKSPFSSVGSLCDYIDLLLEEGAANKRKAG